MRSARDAGLRRTWAMGPAVAIPIEGAIVVVVEPVVEQDEPDDGDSDFSAVAQYRHIGALVRVVDVARIHPATVQAGNHVAPAVVAQTSLHRDFKTRRQDGNHRVIARGTCAKVGIF